MTASKKRPADGEPIESAPFIPLDGKHPKPWTLIEHRGAPERFLCVHDAEGEPVPTEVLFAHYERLQQALYEIAEHDVNPIMGMILTARQALGETGEERWIHKAS